MGKGLLVCISGFSGAGKGTLMKLITETYPEEFALSVSATTRDPRPGETEGKDYFFKTNAEFLQMIAEDRFIEHACYVGHYYGTPKDFVFDKLNRGIDVFLEIDVQGALQVREKFPDTVLIFVTARDRNDLETRLRNRGTETEEVIGKRLLQAKEEVNFAYKYDYILVNDEPDAAMERIRSIVRTEHLKTDRQIQFLDKLKEDLGG